MRGGRVRSSRLRAARTRPPRISRAVGTRAPNGGPPEAPSAMVMARYIPLTCFYPCASLVRLLLFKPQQSDVSLRSVKNQKINLPQRSQRPLRGCTKKRRSSIQLREPRHKHGASPRTRARVPCWVNVPLCSLWRLFIFACKFASEVQDPSPRHAGGGIEVHGGGPGLPVLAGGRAILGAEPLVEAEGRIRMGDRLPGGTHQRREDV